MQVQTSVIPLRAHQMHHNIVNNEQRARCTKEILLVATNKKKNDFWEFFSMCSYSKRMHAF